MDVVTLAAARKYTDESMNGIGSVKGAPCTIQSIVHDDAENENVVTFEWEDSNGEKTNSVMKVPDGIQGIQGETGPQGIQGIQGIKGDKGDKGDTGDTGPIGPIGPQGEPGLDLTAAQELTGAQKAAALENLGIAGAAGLFRAETLGPAGVATVTDGIAGAAVSGLTVSIKPAQAGEGDPSPENVRPITGWTGVNVTVSPTQDAQDGKTYSITFPSEVGTVYGGTLDVVNGTLTVTHEIRDLSSFGWIRDNVDQVRSIDTKLKSAGYVVCDRYKGVQELGWNTLQPGEISVTNSDEVPLLRINSPGIGDALDSIAGYAAIEIQPWAQTSYHLTPQQVRLLAGVNNIFADCGDVTVDYRGDLANLYALDAAKDDRLELIQGDIAPVEGGMYATRNYSAGDYLMLGGRFYKVTAAIANGGAIAAGTNVTETTIAASKQNRLSTSDVFFEMLDEVAAPELHRMIFRGKSLGTSLTSAQKAQISAGTFKGLWLGDYWTISGKVYRIVDFDYWYAQGDTSFTKHHLVVMPDDVMYNAKMNETNTTEGGYVGSQMYTANLETAKTTLQAAFGTSLLTHREYLVNAVTNGKPSGGAWFDSQVDLPNEPMMYGSHFFVPANDGTTIPPRYTLGKTQLALMALCPKFINPKRQTQWLRDVVSAASFAVVNFGGYAAYGGASYSFGVRPVAAIG